MWDYILQDRILITSWYLRRTHTPQCVSSRSSVTLSKIPDDKFFIIPLHILYRVLMLCRNSCRVISSLDEGLAFVRCRSFLEPSVWGVGVEIYVERFLSFFYSCLFPIRLPLSFSWKKTSLFTITHFTIMSFSSLFPLFSSIWFLAHLYLLTIRGS